MATEGDASRSACTRRVTEKRSADRLSYGFDGGRLLTPFSSANDLRLLPSPPTPHHRRQTMVPTTAFFATVCNWPHRMDEKAAHDAVISSVRRFTGAGMFLTADAQNTRRAPHSGSQHALSLKRGLCHAAVAFGFSAKRFFAALRQAFFHRRSAIFCCLNDNCSSQLRKWPVTAFYMPMAETHRVERKGRQKALQKATARVRAVRTALTPPVGRFAFPLTQPNTYVFSRC